MPFLFFTDLELAALQAVYSGDAAVDWDAYDRAKQRILTGVVRDERVNDHELERLRLTFDTFGGATAPKGLTSTGPLEGVYRDPDDPLPKKPA